jgi:predicted small secreted protein
MKSKIKSHLMVDLNDIRHYNLTIILVYVILSFPMIKKISISLSMLLSLSMLSGCYTLYGAGKDMEATGRFVQSKLYIPKVLKR